VVKSKYEDALDMVPDGHSVKVPMVIMDGRPHFADLTDEIRKLRQQTRAEYDRQLTTAWRSNKPVSARDVSPIRPDLKDAAAARDAAYLERSRYLEGAWRKPPHRDAAEPDLSTPPEELMRRHLATEPDRDKAYSDYCSRIQNSWRGVEQQRRAVTHEDSNK
jgi:hypothetical protein